MADQRIVKWAGWLEGTIKNNVLTMHLQRMAWREVAEMLADNPELPESYWWEFMRDTYATTQAVAVRRQADIHRDVASLGRLIYEIGGDSCRLTRSAWLKTQGVDDPYWARVAEQNWAEHYGGAIGQHLDPSIPMADLTSLTEAAASVRRYVDKHVAHAEASRPQVTLTLDEVHSAIDTIGHLFKKYDFLVTGTGWALLEPSIQHNWKAAFMVPWRKPRRRRTTS